MQPVLDAHLNSDFDIVLCSPMLDDCTQKTERVGGVWGGMGRESKQACLCAFTQFQKGSNVAYACNSSTLVAKAEGA
jgi:hypothetical protein